MLVINCSSVVLFSNSLFCEVYWLKLTRVALSSLGLFSLLLTQGDSNSCNLLLSGQVPSSVTNWHLYLLVIQ